jgi:hypothetical protein
MPSAARRPPSISSLAAALTEKARIPTLATQHTSVRPPMPFALDMCRAMTSHRGWIRCGPNRRALPGTGGFSMIPATAPQIVPQQGCARWSERLPRSSLWAALALMMMLGLRGTVDAQGGTPITIANGLPQSSVCANGNTVSIFARGQQVILPGHSLNISGDFSSFPGLGVQVNNWYWTSVSLPVQSGNPQNPDNSGGQFAISPQCVLSQQPAWYGKGVPTYVIATVVAEKTDSGCKITITRNNFTDAVTPGCCSPPGIGSNTCTGPWGVTNGHLGEPWPPK